ncbi:MAG: Uma2 family endonuclease [Planctomycetes bacterium]|nr:Uma2 family endonuclease [Planctomycetota bacterium]
MAVAESSTRLTAEEFLARPDATDFELVHGEMVEVHTGATSNWVGVQIASALNEFARKAGIGVVLAFETHYRCWPDDPDHMRKPDVSFIRHERLPGGELPDGEVRVAPELAVEVISPGDAADDVEVKVSEYLAAGVRMAWVISPKARTVRVYRESGSITLLRERDRLSGEDLLPGFSIPVADILPAHPAR